MAYSPSLPGKVATITRTGGSHQLTYNGHPLVHLHRRHRPGQAKGNNLNLNGGLWHEVPASLVKMNSPRGELSRPAERRAEFVTIDEHDQVRSLPRATRSASASTKQTTSPRSGCPRGRRLPRAARTRMPRRKEIPCVTTLAG